MMARLQRLLLICAMCFVVVRAAFSNESLCYVHIIIEFDVSGKTIKFACMEF